MRRIDEIYKKLCYDLISHGDKINNTLELRNIRFTIPNINENIVGIRNLSAAYLFGEWLWYLSGKNDTKFISSFGSMWEKLSDDGITNNSAYGYIMKYKFGFDQVEKIIELLTIDPNSRRAVINLNTPNKNVIETKDEPCTIALDYYIRNNKLFCTGMMRSNDIWFGLPYDIAFFMQLQKYIANRLHVDYGTYTHFVVSLHVYKKNIDNIKSIVKNPIQKLILYDDFKFWKNIDFVTKLIDTAIRHCKRDTIKNLMLKLAATNFDYNEVYYED